jgi:SnoaL-like domain
MSDQDISSRPWASAETAALFALEWIEAWNSHDLTRILTHYRDDFEMSSPLIIQRGFSPDGVLRGKAVIAEYWKIGLAAQPPLWFELIEVFRGSGMICLLYRSVTRNRRVIEWLRFDETGLVSHAAAIYGEPR